MYLYFYMHVHVRSHEGLNQINHHTDESIVEDSFPIIHSNGMGAASIELIDLRHAEIVHVNVCTAIG